MRTSGWVRFRWVIPLSPAEIAAQRTFSVGIRKNANNFSVRLQFVAFLVAVDICNPLSFIAGIRHSTRLSVSRSASTAVQQRSAMRLRNECYRWGLVHFRSHSVSVDKRAFNVISGRKNRYAFCFKVERRLRVNGPRSHGPVSCQADTSHRCGILRSRPEAADCCYGPELHVLAKPKRKSLSRWGPLLMGVSIYFHAGRH